MLGILELLLSLGLLHPQAPAETTRIETAQQPSEDPREPGRIRAKFRPQLEADLDGKHRVVIMLFDDVDIAKLSRKYPNRATRLRVLRRIRRRQQAPILAAFRRAGLHYEDLHQSRMANALILTATGATVLEMVRVDGVRYVDSNDNVTPKRPRT